MGANQYPVCEAETSSLTGGQRASRAGGGSPRSTHVADQYPVCAAENSSLREDKPRKARLAGGCLAALLILSPSSTHAAGFAVAEQGAESLGRANASTARLDSTDIGYFNQAAWAIEPGLTSSVGIGLIFPQFEHEDEGTTTETISSTGTPPYAHVGGSIALGDWTLGGGATFVVPFGSGLEWPTDWPGRYEVTSIELRTFELGASLAAGYTYRDYSIAVSAGPRFIFGTVALERKVDAVDQEGEVKLTGEDQSFGLQTALAVRYADFTLGASYRSRAKLEFKGFADFAGIPPELSERIRDQAVQTEVTLPDRWAFGLAYDFGFGVASVDAEIFTWSTFETFGIDFENEDTPDVIEPREWHNTVALRLGYEHRILSGLAARAGFAYDPTPSPTDTLSPTLPDSDRFVLGVGAGYTYAPIGLSADLAYSRVFVSENASTGPETFPGTYRGGANIFAISISHQL